MNFYYTPDTKKRLIINSKQTLKDIENLIKDDNPKINEVKFE
jgi:hypothetical protein